MSTSAVVSIDIITWGPHRDPDQRARGYVQEVGRKTVAEVRTLLEEGLAALGLRPEGVTDVRRLLSQPDAPFPPYRWIAAFAVTGGSEGHYIHVDAILSADRVDDRLDQATGFQFSHASVQLYLMKTFEGWAHACAIAQAAGALLSA